MNSKRPEPPQEQPVLAHGEETQKGSDRLKGKKPVITGADRIKS